MMRRLRLLIAGVPQTARHVVMRVRHLWRPLRVGLAFDDLELRVIGVKGDHVMWAFRADRTPGASLDAELADLLTEATSVKGWLRPRVYVAMPFRHARLKCLDGLPSVTDERLLRLLVRESVGRFFLASASSSEATTRLGGVRGIASGRAWIAAYDSPAVDMAVRACRSHRLNLLAVVPACAVVGVALTGERISWAGATLHFDESRTLKAIDGAAPLVTGAANSADSPCVALAVLGGEAWRWADAYGVAVAGSRIAVSLKAGQEDDPGIAPKVPAWRLALASVALLLSIVAAGSAPAALAARAAHRNAAALRVLAPQRRQAMQLEAEFVRVTTSLAEFARFNAATRPTTYVLAHLAHHLPAGSALISVTLDSVGGNVVALAPSAAAVVEAVERTPGIAAPEIVGPVTRELVASSGQARGQGAAYSQVQPPAEMERVTVRFRMDDTGGPRPVDQLTSTKSVVVGASKR